ncbi:site-specific DNA-methyltransferase (plasmid) [Pontibacillus sp. ALD_SL1]|nr:site-specific DNA-methyltransferase [Pontibacillus sp. ALD_SL1]
MNTTLAERIYTTIKNHGKPMKIKEIASEIDDKPETTIRGRLYRHLKDRFVRVARGVYWIVGEGITSSCLVVEGNGRDLSNLEDESVDAIVTDHPWEDKKSNTGGSRKFVSSYEDTAFRYTQEDFDEKARVLREGSFLVEFIPAENENNYQYLYEMKRMAEKAGFRYYSKVAWKKGTFVSNTGRKSKNTEEVLFFTKGKARNLRPDQKKIKATGFHHTMSGAKGMLPTMFDVQPPSRKERVHQAEKPIELYEEIIELITEPGEIVLDQFAGSGNMGIAAITKKRFGILYELLKESVEGIKDRLTSFCGIEREPYVMTS